jgi:hypothetical protein
VKSYEPDQVRETSKRLQYSHPENYLNAMSRLPNCQDFILDITWRCGYFSCVEAADDKRKRDLIDKPLLRRTRNGVEIMRYNHLLALSLAAGLVSAASGLAIASPSGVATEHAKLGFAAVAAAPATAPSYALLAAYDDNPGSVDKQGRVERVERDRGDLGDRGDHFDNRPNRPHR